MSSRTESSVAKPHIVFHHAVHDLPIIAELFNTDVERLLSSITFDDTMVMAYVLRLVPQGLKPLARRFNGRQRDSFMDIVREPEQKIAVEYLRTLLKNRCANCEGDGTVIVEPMGARGKPLPPRPVRCDICEGDGTAWPSPEERIEYKNGQPKLARGQRIGTRVRTVLRKLAEGKDVDEFDDGSDDDAEVGESADDNTEGLRHWWLKKVAYDYRLTIEDVAGPMPEVSLDNVEPQSKAVEYSAADADDTIRIYNVLSKQIEQEGLKQIYEINRDTLPMLTVMMERGTYLDIPYLKQLDVRLERECDVLMYQLQQAAGHYVNPGSSKQVAELLFDELKLPVVKETKGGDASTQDKVLEDLKLQVAARPNSRQNDRIIEVLTIIGDYRERHKLRGTYTLALPRKVDSNSRIHTTFKSTRTETNRLSSADPNLQNIPARSDLGKLVRGAFTATPGFVLVAADYSQIEVRVIAHASKDKRLVDGIRQGLDVHYVTASTIFKTPIDKVTKQQRAISKRITFLILYGGGAERLKAELKLDGIDVTIEEAQGYIDAYLTVAYPGISDYMDEMVERAKRFGYVEDMFGWRRYLPGVHSALDGVRMEAERMAVNAPIQSGAAGIMRMACPVILNEVVPKQRKRGFETWPLLTVHDEFVLETKAGGEQLLLDDLIPAMTEVMALDVPVLAEGAVGFRWNELKG